MAKKLTPTEMKTLAVEATNRVLKAISDHNKEITESGSYKNYNITLAEQPIGKMFAQIKDLTGNANSFMEINAPKDPNRYVSNDRFSVDSTIETCIEKLRDVEYPLVKEAQVIPKDWNDVTGYNPPSVFQYIEHSVKLKQLTADLDIKTVLEGMVKELIDNIGRND